MLFSCHRLVRLQCITRLKTFSLPPPGLAQNRSFLQQCEFFAEILVFAVHFLHFHFSFLHGIIKRIRHVLNKYIYSWLQRMKTKNEDQLRFDQRTCIYEIDVLCFDTKLLVQNHKSQKQCFPLKSTPCKLDKL